MLSELELFLNVWHCLYLETKSNTEELQSYNLVIFFTKTDAKHCFTELLIG